MAKDCTLCQQSGGELLWQNDFCRVVLVDDKQLAGMCRVIAQQHIKEMSDLNPAQQIAMMQVVFAVEKVMREVLRCDKINLASLGNKTPHLHWHIMPRYHDDAHFPESIWATPQRPMKALDSALLQSFTAQLQQHLNQIA